METNLCKKPKNFWFSLDFKGAHGDELRTPVSTFSDSSRHELQLFLWVSYPDSTKSWSKKILLYSVIFENEKMSMKNDFLDKLLVDSGYDTQIKSCNS